MNNFTRWVFWFLVALFLWVLFVGVATSVWFGLVDLVGMIMRWTTIDVTSL